MIKGKTTKGAKKMKYFLTDLLVNEKFLKEISQYKRLSALPFEKVTDSLLDERDRLVLLICLQYGLEYKDFELLLKLLESNEFSGEFKNTPFFPIDVCTISENLEDDFGETGGSFPKPTECIEDTANRCAYPLSINIRSQASKNDVLDYIDKNWKEIEKWLSWTRKKNKTNIRKRAKIEISNFIWKHKDLPAKELQTLINDSFPEETIIYSEINKIKSLEKRRRAKDLTLLK